MKISVFGAGGTGAQVALALAYRGNVDITLIDIAEDMTVGKALDIGQCGAILGKDYTVQAGSDWAMIEDSDIVVITAGKGRQPGLNREDLLLQNGRLVADMARACAQLCPETFMIVLTNPADLLTRVAAQVSGFPTHRVIGQGGILDSARMCTLVAHTLGISIKDVRAMVLGGHGDSMVPVKDFVSVYGAPVRDLLSSDAWNDIVQRTRFGGSEILDRFRVHGASVTPGFAVAEMIDALCSPTPRLLPVSTAANGAFGLRDVFLGLPALVSRRGVERVLELPLCESDLRHLHQSAEQLEVAWRSWLAATCQPQADSV